MTNRCVEEPSNFDTCTWKTLCEKRQSEAISHSGCIYELFVDNFSSMIDIDLSTTSNEHKPIAIKIALDFGYASVSEREKKASLSKKNGYCVHHIEPDCCPVGCGSL